MLERILIPQKGGRPRKDKNEYGVPGLFPDYSIISLNWDKNIGYC